MKNAIPTSNRMTIRSLTLDGDNAKQVVTYFKNKNKENESVCIQKYILLPNEKIPAYDDFRVIKRFRTKSLVYQCFSIKTNSFDAIVDFVNGEK